MCAGDCQFFPSALPSYLVQSHKKTGYIYGRHILSSYIFYIFLHLTFYLIQSHKKQPIFIYLYITYLIKIFFTFSITYQYSHFHPFLVQRHKKTTYIDVTYFLTMCFIFFLSYINFPSLLVELYKRQPNMEGAYFLHPSHILISHVSNFSPSLLSGCSGSKKTVPCLWCTKEQPVRCTYHAKIKLV